MNVEILLPNRRHARPAESSKAACNSIASVMQEIEGSDNPGDCPDRMQPSRRYSLWRLRPTMLAPVIVVETNKFIPS